MPRSSRRWGQITWLARVFLPLPVRTFSSASLLRTSAHRLPPLGQIFTHAQVFLAAGADHLACPSLLPLPVRTFPSASLLRTFLSPTSPAGGRSSRCPGLSRSGGQICSHARVFLVLSMGVVGQLGHGLKVNAQRLEGCSGCSSFRVQRLQRLDDWVLRTLRAGARFSGRIAFRCYAILGVAWALVGAAMLCHGLSSRFLPGFGWYGGFPRPQPGTHGASAQACFAYCRGHGSR